MNKFCVFIVLGMLISVAICANAGKQNGLASNPAAGSSSSSSSSSSESRIDSDLQQLIAEEKIANDLLKTADQDLQSIASAENSDSQKQ